MSTAHDADHAALPETASAPAPAFVPTRQQLRYLEAYVAADGSENKTELARRAHVNRVTVWDWFNSAPFCDWFVAQLNRLLLSDYQLALRTTVRLAKQGSSDHMKLLMIKMGDIRHGNANSFDDLRNNGGQQTVVLINVPSPRTLSPAEVIDTTPLVAPAVIEAAPSDREH